MYEDRVSNGAGLLDRVRPGWAAEVDPGRLAMDSYTDDVLGQLYGNFIFGFVMVLKPLPASERFASSSFGFTLKDDEQDTRLDTDEVILARFAALADAWRAAIRQRLEPAAVAP